LLDPIRPFVAEDYTTLVAPFPGSDVLALNTPPGLLAYQDAPDRMQLPPGAWLVGWSAYSQQAAGIQFRVFDEGRGRVALAGKSMRNAIAQDNNDTDPALPYFLDQPYYVVTPGWLQITVTNIASVANDAQVALYFAIPRRRTK
jgi:hypothetical protein